MKRPSRSRTRAAAAWGAVALAALGAAPTAQAAGWGGTFRLAGPLAHDLAPSRAAFSAAGDLAVGYARSDEENAAGAQAYVVIRSARGRVASPQAIPNAQQVLDLIYDGTGLQLLVGGSERGQACCSYARVTSLTSSGFSRPQTVISGLTGSALGRLIVVGSGRILAAVAAAHGVWAAQSPGGDRLSATRRLASAATEPWTLGAAILASGRTFVGWTAASPQTGGAGPGVLTLAQGSPQSTPRGPRSALRLQSGHELDELALASAGRVALAAWIESWFTSAGQYQSEAVVGDLTSHVAPHGFSGAPGLASGIAAAGHGNGQDVVAWKTCDASAVCTTWAAFRPAGGHFGSPARLGSVDAGEDPVVAITVSGQAVVGWVSGGRVQVTSHGPSGGGFSGGRTLGSSYAHDLTLAVAPGGGAAAVWTEGTVTPSVDGARYSG